MGAPQIVIAEDEGGLRSLIAELLEARDLKVLEAEDGRQAYELLRKNSGVSLLLSDVRTPNMDGYELVEKALDLRPELKVLMMTGYAQERPPSELMRAREIRTLHKPVDLERLSDLVCEMLSRP
jgi:DNA-binding NtrC family response regulator